MYALYPILFLLLWASPTHQISRDLTYEELEELNATCYRLDSCNVRRSSDSLKKYTCQCGSYCANLETCCVDAPFRDRDKSGQQHTCRAVNGELELHYFMVDQCSSRNTDRQMEKLCREDWNKDDLLQLTPVTSKSSKLTYKNYFCFRCNEATDGFLYWNVKLNSAVVPDSQKQEVVPTYDTTRHTWTAPFGKGGSYVPVELFFDIPKEIEYIPNMCVTHAISSCSRQWKLRDVKRKCGQYTSYVYVVKFFSVSYKNPHCALCNFESLDKMGCGVTAIPSTAFRKPFSFAHVIDINRSDGDKVGLIERCDSKSVWDPFYDKCRPYTCAIPWFIVKNGKCTPP